MRTSPLLLSLLLWGCTENNNPYEPVDEPEEATACGEAPCIHPPLEVEHGPED